MKAYAFALVVALLLPGCASLPSEVASLIQRTRREGEDAPQQRLAAHVAFLTHPDLKGRRSGTRGAKLAQEYVEQQFKACGLVPWMGEKSYAMPFGLGTNVVGVLPGSDPSL